MKMKKRILLKSRISRIPLGFSNFPLGRIKNWFVICIILLVVPILLSTGSLAADGCCTLTCKQSDESYCPNFFEAGENCNEIEQCNIGCCLDEEEYCLGNFLKGNCERLNGKFISKKECRQHIHCLTEPSKISLREYTGFPFLFENEDIGMLSVIPVSGERGDTFKIRDVISEIEGLDRVEAEISHDTYFDISQLYNDGSHGDGNEDDTIFANNWDSSNIESFYGTKNINVDIVTYRGGNVNKSGNTHFTLIDNIKCLPIFKLWQDNSSKSGIIFAGYDYTSNTIKKELRKDAEAAIGALYPIDYFRDELDELNFYITLENMARKDSSYVQEYMREQCFLYDEVEDYVILFDKDQLMCEQQGNIIITNPVMYPDREEIQSIQGFDEIMDNFCVYMLTEQKLIENEMLKYEGPKITVRKPLNNSVFDTSYIDVAFTITDSKNTYMDYNVYLDTDIQETTYLSGTATNNVEITGNISDIPDGWHELHMEAWDSDGNLGLLEPVSFFVNVSNFVIDFIYPDSTAYNESPVIEFKISHATAQDVNYSVFINGGLFANGSTAVNQVVSLSTNLTEGDYKIKITATDNESRSTWYMPAPFYLDKQKPVIEILTPANSDTSELRFKVTDNKDDYLLYKIYVGSAAKEESFIDSGMVESVQLSGLPNLVTIIVADFAGNTNSESVFLGSGLMPSPPAAGLNDIILSILVMIMTFLIAIALIVYHKK